MKQKHRSNKRSRSQSKLSNKRRNSHPPSRSRKQVLTAATLFEMLHQSEILLHYHLQSMLDLLSDLPALTMENPSYNLYEDLLPHVNSIYSIVRTQYDPAEFQKMYSVLSGVVEKCKKYFHGNDLLDQLAGVGISAMISALANLWEYMHNGEDQSYLYAHYDILGIHAYITEIVTLFEEQGIQTIPKRYILPPLSTLTDSFSLFLQKPDEILKLRLAMQYEVFRNESRKN